MQCRLLAPFLTNTYLNRFDRDVPVMYNSLDVNSQEPMLFDMNSQSQTPISPEKEAPFLLPKPTTPAFTSRNLLFLSPSAKKPAACQSVLAKSIALLPTTSPEPPAEDADKNNQTIVSLFFALSKHCLYLGNECQ